MLSKQYASLSEINPGHGIPILFNSLTTNNPNIVQDSIGRFYDTIVTSIGNLSGTLAKSILDHEYFYFFSNWEVGLQLSHQYETVL